MSDSKPTEGAPQNTPVPSPPLPPVPKPGAAPPRPAGKPEGKEAAAPPVPSPPLPPVAPVGEAAPQNAAKQDEPKTGSTYSWSLDDDLKTDPKNTPAATGFKAAPAEPPQADEAPAAAPPAQPKRPAPSQPSKPAQQQALRSPAAPGGARTPSAPRTPSVPRTPPLPRTAATKQAPPSAPSPAMPQSPNFPTGESKEARPPAAAPTFSRAHSHDSSDWAEDVAKLAPTAALITNGSLFFGVLALGFLVYAIATGQTASVSEVSNMTTAAALLNLCVAAASVGLIITQWQSRAIGGTVAAVGFALLLAAPAVLPEAASSAASFFRGGGVFLFAVGLAKIGAEILLGSGSSGSSRSGQSTRAASGAPIAPASSPAQHPLAGEPAASATGAGYVEDPADISVPQKILEALDPLAFWLFRIGAVTGALSLAYILYAIFAGGIGEPGVAAQMVRNLGLASTALTWSIVLVALSGVILALDVKSFGGALAVGGLALHFGSSWVIFNFVGTTAATTAIVGGLRNAGAWLIVLGVLKATYDLYLWMVALPERNKQQADVGVGKKAEAAQQRVARDSNAFSPCWKLPFCREVIRKQCPAFLAKKTCWKFGRGCYCDEEMISRIIRGESLEVIKAPTRLSKTGKPPCGRCHIYLEHQGHKFKMLSPLALPATVAVMYFIWPYWQMLFSAFSNAPIWDALSFDSTKLAPEAIATKEAVDTGGGLPADQVINVATIMFGVLIGFFVLIYISKLIEWAVYKAKL